MREASPVRTSSHDRTAPRALTRYHDDARHCLVTLEPICLAVGDGLLIGRDHPLHLVDRVVRDCLREPAAQQLLDSLEAGISDAAPAPERMLRGLLLQLLYAIDCEQRLLEQLRYDLRFRWFTGLALGAAIWSRADHAAFRDRLLAGPEGRQLLDELLRSLRPIARTWPEQFGFDERIGERWQQAPPRPASVADDLPGARHRQLLHSVGLPEAGGSIDGRLLRVLEAILTRICAPGLNADRLASEVGMSRRALFYLFDAHGLTPAAAIRNMRLDHCRRLLGDARHSQRKIAAIALDHGFGNVSSFSRCFKQRYGYGPRQCRVDQRSLPQAARHG